MRRARIIGGPSLGPTRRESASEPPRRMRPRRSSAPSDVGNAVGEHGLVLRIELELWPHLTRTKGAGPRLAFRAVVVGYRRPLPAPPASTIAEMLDPMSARRTITFLMP